MYACETGVCGDEGGENSITLCSGLWRGLYSDMTFSCNRAGSSIVLTVGEVVMPPLLQAGLLFSEPCFAAVFQLAL